MVSSFRLKRRFQFMGLATLIFAPLISIYLVLYFFFRYFEVKAEKVLHHIGNVLILCILITCLVFWKIIGIPQEPQLHWNKTVHSPSQVEI